MIKKLIIFLIRKKLGVDLYDEFQFTNQKSKHDYYFFEPDVLMKAEFDVEYETPDGIDFIGSIEYRPANVSLNWLLSDDCKIKKLD